MTFLATPNYGSATLTPLLEDGLKIWLDIALLARSCWRTTLATPPVNGPDAGILRPCPDPRFPAGLAYEGARKSWVYESGGDWPVCAGVTVGDTFVPRGLLGETGKCLINFPSGRVILWEAPPPGAVVRAEYASRIYEVTTASHPAWREGEANSFLAPGRAGFVTNPEYRPAEARVQYPCCVIEAVPGGRRRGYSLGSTTHVVERDVLFHCFARDRHELAYLTDALESQQDAAVPLINRRAAELAGVWPLDPWGNLLPTGLSPETLAQLPEDGGYRMALARVTRTSVSEQPTDAGTVWATVRLAINFVWPQG